MVMKWSEQEASTVVKSIQSVFGEARLCFESQPIHDSAKQRIERPLMRRVKSASGMSDKKEKEASLAGKMSRLSLKNFNS